jgi:serine/threonine-protein kinase
MPTVEFRTPVWVDRAGHEEPIEMPRHSYAVPRISPDGTRIALDARDSGNDIWIWDLARRTLSRLTNDPANDLNPLWTNDGRRIVFASSRNGNPNLYLQSADGTGTPERLTDSVLPQFPTSISPDEKRIVLFELGTAPDILVVPLDGDRKAVPLFKTPSSELNGAISPDGRWLAYQSNESGISEVYVRPFPNVDGGRWTISSGGGSRPAWGAKSSELFYLDSKNLLTSVGVQTNGSTFSASVARTVLKTAYYPGFSITGADLRGYDVAADGQRFLMLKENPSTNTAVPTLAVVLNWRETLGK